MPPVSIIDKSSFSNLNHHLIKHLSLDITVDFENTLFQGKAEYTISTLSKNQPLVFDISDQKIKSIVDSDNNNPIKFAITGKTAYGQKLEIQLSESCTKFLIHFTTSPSASALQWLDPSQTAGKVHPFVFAQCQAIHARSVFPCQDTPGNKFTYDAQVTVPSPLVACCSANPVKSLSSPDNKSQTFYFVQNTPIPSYLFGICVGDITQKDLSPRCRVYAEPAQIKAAAYEFAEIEDFLKIFEGFLPPYAWGRYDFIVMPPSFPYGGMEIPQLTLLTPTLLAGDRSLVNVLSHELAHSWSGNLVTNKNWNNFWLNEGFTVYLERRSLAKKYGQAEADLSAIEGYKALEDSIAHLSATSDYTKLIIPQVTDPDECFSSVPYEKGFNLLYYIATLVGGHDQMEKFLFQWFSKHANGHVTSEDFAKEVTEFFPDCTALKSFDWDSWYNKAGMPPVKNKFDDSLAKDAEKAAQEWITACETKDFSQCKIDITKLSATATIVFFNALLSKVSTLNSSMIQEMRNRFGLAFFLRNAEIKFRWFRLSIQLENFQDIEDCFAFLLEQGRMKFVRPLFRDLFSSKFATKARLVFTKNKANYHPICSKMVSQDMENSLSSATSTSASSAST